MLSKNDCFPVIANIGLVCLVEVLFYRATKDSEVCRREFSSYVLPLDLSSPAALICRGAPTGPVPKPSTNVCVPAFPAAHSESGGADPALWRDGLQNCPSGRYLHWKVQRQNTTGQQSPV